uniref:Protein NLRC5-like n=1 Tax=Poecilia latipinna TaxID=48699 RepID=A0A3B3VHB6_9TELE
MISLFRKLNLPADYWEQYKAEAAGSLQQRWRRLSEGLLKDVQPDKIWVSIRTANRARDRPDQTPSSAERGGRTPEPEGDDGWPESRLTLESFLQGCTGKVTVLAGQPGSGKTLLMSFIGQQWTKGLGPIPSSHLFVLLELRQLNLLSDPLSLSELLFHHYLPTNGDNEAKQAVVDYLLSNPEQSCWVLDGYDEFQKKLKRHRVQNERLDSEKPRPVAELISGLLSRRLLAGSTVLVTSRVRDVVDLDGLSDKVGQLLPWDHREIKECVNNFFSGKDGNLAANAAEILFSSRHLLAMSSLPALCNICCVFLQHSLRSMFSFTSAQIPSTQTQIYLAAVVAFLNRHTDRTGGNNAAEISGFSQSTKFAWKTVSLPAAELCELSRVAWRGLEESRIIFLDEDVPLQTLQSSVKSGLFSQMEVRGRGGGVVNAYCFLHLTVQEFLAALRIMTSSDVSDADLKKKFSLKTRWTTKSDQKTVFTDSLYLYVCGLASSDCTPALEVVAKATGLKAAQNWVQKRQALVLKLLEALCRSASLTGPKILQLCHCVQESQNQQLAQQVVRVRPTLELRNFWLLTSDIEALAFVVNSVGTKDVGLDFGACSMELECLDILSRCQYIHYLSFRSRKYGDKFAEKLSSVLPRFIALRKLEFCGASLSSAGAASLASGLQNCPSVTELNFSDNNLQDEGIRHIADVLAKLQNLASVKLGRNNTSLEAAECLVKHVSSCSNIQQVHAEILQMKWTKSGMQNLARSLARCPSLSELDLSGGEWDEETLKMLTQFVPNFSITDRIILNDSCSSVQSAVILTALLSDCLSVMEMNIRLQDPVQVSVVFSGGREKTANVSSKTLCLSCCNLQPIDLERVWRSLGASSDLSDLDLSCNKLGDKGLKKLLDFLPRLSKIQRVDFSGNDVSVDGVVMLADALCSSNRLTHVYIRYQFVFVFFRINRRSLTVSDVNKVCRKLVQCRTSLELEFTQYFHIYTETKNDFCSLNIKTDQSVSVSRLTDFSFKEENFVLLDRLNQILQQSRQLSYLDLSGNQLEDEGVRCLLKSLPNIRVSSFINKNGLSQQGALHVATALCTCTNVSAVEVSLGEDERCLIWFRQKGGEKTLSSGFMKPLTRCMMTCCSSSLFSISVEERWIGDDEAASLLRRCLQLNKPVQTPFSGCQLALKPKSAFCLTCSVNVKTKQTDSVSFLIIVFFSSLSKNLVSDPSGEKLLEALSGCRHLEELHISENSVGNEGLLSLSRAIMSLKNLRKIHLTSVRNSELSAVAASLSHCPFIQDVGFGWNNCGDDVALELAKVLPVCHDLTRIDLECNSVSAAGVEALVRALRCCPALQVIRLWKNKVSPNEAYRFSQMERRLKFSST